MLSFKLRMLNSVRSVFVEHALSTWHFSESIESLVPIKSELSARLSMCYNCSKVFKVLSVLFL